MGANKSKHTASAHAPVPALPDNHPIAAAGGDGFITAARGNYSYVPANSNAAGSVVVKPGPNNSLNGVYFVRSTAMPDERVAKLKDKLQGSGEEHAAESVTLPAAAEVLPVLPPPAARMQVPPLALDRNHAAPV